MQVVLGKNPDGKSIVLVVGGATKDAEVKVFGEKSTKKVCLSLGLGKNKNDENIYANCDVFGRLRGYASTIEKADVVMAIGTIHSYTSPTNGKTYNTLNVEWINKMKDLPIQDSSDYSSEFGGDSSAASGSESFQEVSEDEEDLPF